MRDYLGHVDTTPEIWELMADTPAKNQQQLRGLLHPIRDKALDELHIEPALPHGYSKGEPIAVNW